MAFFGEIAPVPLLFILLAEKLILFVILSFRWNIGNFYHLFWWVVIVRSVQNI